ncbi:MAG: toll/interleukin-1 receptor domain-containing protein [Bacteroidales bacterium]|nr:toll/interleukin-1 receptor domain-containing protein [Bacteroidales bacterium]
MIFLSHNWKDKPVVEQVALRLRSIFGQKNVFYDSWSIQPGDGIIDKMNEGLSNCQYFFFFISTNSLASNMVKMEWQNAIFKAAQNAIKFIPIRMDNSTMPVLLTQSLYIDLYSQGLEVAVRQIIDVIQGNNTFRIPTSQFHNLIAEKQRIGNKLRITCRALHFLEPISSFAFCTLNDIDGITVNVLNETMNTSSDQKDVPLTSGLKVNTFVRGVQHGTTPDMPFMVEFDISKNPDFDIMMVMHKTSHERFDEIPLKVIG